MAKKLFFRLLNHIQSPAAIAHILHHLFRNDGVDIAPHHTDCGLMIFDRETQDVHAGGSGCGCAASVLWSRLFLKEKLSWKHYAMILLVVIGIVIMGVFDM